MRARVRSSALVLALAAAGACGHSAVPTAVSPTAGGVDVEESEGRQLAVLPFPTTGLVHVSLWVDAGSRDASPPAVATLAAELAAAAAGDDVRAWVSPDGIELATEGEAEELDALFARLGRALAVRSVDREQMAARLAELGVRRRRALADAARTASALSLRALLGEASEGLFPLGDAADEPPRSEDVERFLAAHFGAERTLSIVAGDIERERAREAWSRASRGFPRALAVRAERGALAGRDGVAVAVDRASAFAATALLPSIETALAARNLLEAEGSAAGATTFAYAVRGGALLSLVRGGGSGSPGAQRATMHALLRAVDAAHPSAADPSWATSPSDAARQIGVRWSTRSAEAPSAVAVGVGAVVAGGRGDDLEARDPDRAVRDRATEALEASLEWARAAARPELGPSEDAPGFSALPNGARVRAATTPPGSPFGIAVAFDGGITEEPPDAQGRAAILAEALASRCGRAIGERATVRSFVDEGTFGVSLEASPERWAESATRFLACVLGAELDARSIEDARVALAARLEAEPDAALYAALSQAIAPAAPSLVWPFGTRESIERVRVAGVSTALARARVGRRLRAAVLGPLPAAASARLVAAALAPLPPGQAPPPAAPGAALGGPIALDSPSPFLVSALRLPPGPASGARAYAEAYADALREAGFRAELAAGGGGRWGRWAAVRIHGTAEALPSIAEAARAIRPSPARFGVRARERARARRWAEGRPGAFAALTAVRASDDDLDGERELPEPSAHVLLVGREQPDAAYERLRNARSGARPAR